MNATVWVPPVPGKHAHGYHLARVRYDSLDRIRQDARFVFAASTEYPLRPDVDLAAVMTHTSEVHAGVGLPHRTGQGVRIAIADTGVDLSHPDIPAPIEAFDMTDGTGPGTWGTDVRNHVTFHGTHVTGIAVGRGLLSGGRYRGSAPAAELCFYKVRNDTTSNIATEDSIEAINRALAVGCRVYSQSSSGYSTYMDGSSALDQAVDAAFAAGMICFNSAGNAATRGEHDSISVPPGTISAEFAMTISNSSGTSAYTGDESIRVIWRDDNPATLNISLSCTNLGTGETLTLVFSGASSRQTEARRYTLKPNIAAGASKTYLLRLQNTAGAGATPLVHCYRSSGRGSFDDADMNYTVASPAHADNAIAVGAWIHRKQWADHRGFDYIVSSYTVGTLAAYSSRGPRIDGLRKPDVVAPGAMMISTRDLTPGLAVTPSAMIDNDGLNLNGSGPADYYITEGTSMACPFAAGVAALIIEDRLFWTPAQVRARLEQTAGMAATPDNQVGHGLINALAAVSHTRGDFDGNGQVDAADFEIFAPCATHAAVPYDVLSLPIGCSLAADGEGILSADFDRDYDIDQSDFGEWQLEYKAVAP